MSSNDLAGFLMGGLFMLLTATTIILRGPLGKALARRLAGGSAGSDPAQLEEMDALRARLADVEERLDFAERLLSRAEVRGGSLREGAEP